MITGDWASSEGAPPSRALLRKLIALFKLSLAAPVLVMTTGCGEAGSPPPQQPAAERADPAGAQQPLAEPTAPANKQPRPIRPPQVVTDGARDRKKKKDPPLFFGQPLSRPSPAAPTSEEQPAAEAKMQPAAPEIDEARVEANGIRKLSGERLTLYTDLPLDDEIKSLPAAFDQAYLQWLDYFELPDSEQTRWRAVGRLMKDEAKFRAAGLLPSDLPQFVNGYTRGDDFWWREQLSPYYRRHLMLHEGTHAFTFHRFGTCGPPWYMEGMAELLATHSWRDGRLQLGVFPENREDFPYWGRIKIVREAVKANGAKSLEEVLAFAPGLHAAVEPYGWCWATAAFLDGHPRYRQRFRQMPRALQAPDFNRRLKEVFADDWLQLDEEWQCYILDLEYGYDLVRNAIDFKPGEPLPAAGARAAVAADRGWQSTGIRLEANKKYSLRASGRYQLGQQPQIWWCEPNGVTIRYYCGKPLGVLMAAVHPEPYDPIAVSSLSSPLIVGLGTELVPEETGTLYLRINDSPAELGDNVGAVEVEIAAE